MADTFFVLIATHYDTTKIVAVSRDRHKLQSLADTVSHILEPDTEIVNQRMAQWDAENPKPVAPPMPERLDGLSRKEYEYSPSFMAWNEEYNKYLVATGRHGHNRRRFQHSVEDELVSQIQWPIELIGREELKDYDYRFSIEEVSEI